MESSANSPRPVLLDANVLSRLAKIGRLDLVPHVFPGRCFITPAIYHEIRVGIEAEIVYLRAVETVVANGDLRVVELKQADLEFVTLVPRKLARGEAEGIALCRRLDMIFVTHDRKAANYCDRIGVTCLHFRSLVEALRRRNLLSEQEAAEALA